MAEMEAIRAIAGDVSEFMDCGAGNLVLTVQNDISMTKYKQYIEKLALQGYTLYADNYDAVPIVKYVKTVTYVKDSVFFTVTHMVNTEITYLSYCENIALSPRLKYSESYVANNMDGVNTTLHNLEMFWFGNSIVIQLKNGHFIISDGGLDHREALLSDAEYLLQYLEELAPNGTKPVVEAWVISHLHTDHCGLMKDFVDGSADASRLYVEGLYYSEPRKEIFDLTHSDWNDALSVRAVAKVFQTTSGEHPEIYRIQTGQRYYFNDITMDIVFTQEQLPFSEYANVECPEDENKKNLNDSSTWCMFTIEGQKVLFTGDADKGGMDAVMKAYDREYLTLTAYVTPQHTWNPYQPIVDYITTEVVIATADVLCTSEYIAELYPDTPKYVVWYAPNSELDKKAKEVFGWGEGTVVMTFPYEPNHLKVIEKKKRRKE